MSDVYEDAKLHQLRAWLSGEKCVPAGFVTRERLMVLGLDSREAERAVRFANDPYNHGADPYLSHVERLAHKRRALAERSGWVRSAPVQEASPVRHWASRVKSDAAVEQIRRARAKAGIISGVPS